MRGRWGSWGTLAVVLSLAAPASPALAHARLIESEPAHRAALKAAPKQVRLTFNSLVEQRFVRLTLTGAGGQAHPLIHAPKQPGQARVLVIPLPALRPGAYRLTWSVVSADGHRVEGAIAFSIR
ncbi:MAG: copper resistance CopC family protein [Candidatus Sericytochromatia bacterium]